MAKEEEIEMAIDKVKVLEEEVIIEEKEGGIEEIEGTEETEAIEVIEIIEEIEEIEDLEEIKKKKEKEKMMIVIVEMTDLRRSGLKLPQSNQEMKILTSMLK